MASVVLLAGGTGGAKLARGLLDELGPDLTVIANTGDDVEIYGAYVSPDPDLVTFWLADAIDERGWGLDGDTFAAMEQLRALGEDVWFNLGDRDLAIGLHRAGRLAAGARLTEAIDDLRRAFGVPARVLVPTDDPLRTLGPRARRVAAVPGVHDPRAGRGTDRGRRVPRRALRPPPRRSAALRAARHDPDRPVEPRVLDRPDPERAAGRGARARSAPVVAVSPLVRGQVLKGPTAECLRWAGRTLDSDGIVDHYEGLIDALVADERAEHVPTLETDVDLSTPDARRRVAHEVLAFAAALA